MTWDAPIDDPDLEGHVRWMEAELARLRDLLDYIAANASGGDVPESWPEWVSDQLHALKGAE